MSEDEINEKAAAMQREHIAKADALKLARKARGLRERAEWERENGGDALGIMNDIATATRIETYLSSLSEGMTRHSMFRCIIVNATRPRDRAPKHNKPRLPYMIDTRMGHNGEARPIHEKTLKLHFK